MNIGKRIAEERKRLGHSQVAFAKLVGVSLSSQKRYELGERLPDIEYADALQDIGVNVSYVLRGEIPDQGDLETSTFAVANTFCISKQELENILEKSLSDSDKEGYDLVVFFNEMVRISSVFRLAIDKYSEFDPRLLESTLQGIDDVIINNKINITSAKKAQATVMLYRAFKASGHVDQMRIDDTVKLAAS